MHMRIASASPTCNHETTETTGYPAIAITPLGAARFAYQAAYFTLAFTAPTPCSALTLIATHPWRPDAQPGRLSIVSLRVNSTYLVARARVGVGLGQISGFWLELGLGLGRGQRLGLGFGLGVAVNSAYSVLRPADLPNLTTAFSELAFAIISAERWRVVIDDFSVFSWVCSVDSFAVAVARMSTMLAPN